MTEDQAKQRFLLLNLVRILAVALFVFGAAILSGKGPTGLPNWVGYFFVAFGALDFFFVPMLLKKAWQNPDK